jgi:hypothetical protein
MIVPPEIINDTTESLFANENKSRFILKCKLQTTIKVVLF